MTNKGPDVDDSTSKAVQYSRQNYVFFLFSILSYKGGLHPYKEASCLTMLGTIFYIMIL